MFLLITNLVLVALLHNKETKFGCYLLVLFSPGWVYLAIAETFEGGIELLYRGYRASDLPRLTAADSWACKCTIGPF